jgi:hypothetical protein
MRLVFAHLDENYLKALRALFKFTPVSSSHVVPVIMSVPPLLLYASLQKTHPAPVALITTAAGHADENGSDSNVVHCPLQRNLHSTLLSLLRRREHDVVVIQPPADVRELHAAVVCAMRDWKTK